MVVAKTDRGHHRARRAVRGRTAALSEATTSITGSVDQDGSAEGWMGAYRARSTASTTRSRLAAWSGAAERPVDAETPLLRGARGSAR